MIIAAKDTESLEQASKPENGCDMDVIAKAKDRLIEVRARRLFRR